MYESFAEQFEVHARDSAYNAHYERPALLQLAGDVRGLNVLDAGCGPGFHTEALVTSGAHVIACDASPTMVRLTRERVGDAATVRLADLDESLDWLADGSMDLVLMALVLHHLDQPRRALDEIRRVLRPAGHLVLSTQHPTLDWMRFGGSYFERERIHETWQQGWEVSYWRQPLDGWCAEFARAGFLIERLVEPRPAATMEQRDPDTYAKRSIAPGFIAFRLVAA
jgi:ubiquinone/menaquinone biosynthesis C-methylase UbiE